MEVSEEKLDELVEQRLVQMIKENSPKLISFFVMQMGKEAVKTNAGTITVSVNATIEGQRYKITTKTTKKILK